MFDLTLIYHIVHGLGALDFSHCVQLQYSWASDEMKQFSRVNSRAFCFSNRCIDAWNSLSSDIVFASSVCAFKNRLKRVDFSNYLHVN